QRITLGLFALWAGATSILTLILPRWGAHQLFSVNLTAPQVLFWQLYGGARLGLALTALIAAYMPKPPRALVWAVTLGLFAEVVGPVFSLIISQLALADVKPYQKWLAADALFAIVLGGTQAARRVMRPKIQS